VQYAERLPIGKESVIRNVPAATVKAFYQRWYRPEHMAVVVTGDFAVRNSIFCVHMVIMNVVQENFLYFWFPCQKQKYQHIYKLLAHIASKYGRLENTLNIEIYSVDFLDC